MAGVVRDWRAELVESYPDLFRSGDPPRVQGWPAVGDGWRDLMQRACVRIRAAVQADGGTFKFTQIKEKFGSARLYWDGKLPPEGAAQVEDAIDLAEARSACTCEVCGHEGRLYGPGWLLTRCDAHNEGRQREPIRPGMENIFFETRIVGGQREVRCRRYVRETDSFVDVDLSTLEIEED
ncbi:hypothetical protein [Bradyrhizobium sp.]|uniref:hypothetical protein n=1 Tax=Bradyrhizobium sp. TaxID=376 RepID=UPI0026017B9F|nr:hypothetical protein [Bradyrhizobium sp.]